MNVRAIFIGAALVLFALRIANADSRFRADPDQVKREADVLADASRPEPDRLDAVTVLRVWLNNFGAFNFESALPVLKIVRGEQNGVGIRAATLYEDLRVAQKRNNKRIPNPPPIEFDLLLLPGTIHR